MIREQTKLIRTTLAAAALLDAGAASFNRLFQIAPEVHNQVFQIAPPPPLTFTSLPTNLTDNVDTLPGLLKRYAGYNFNEQHCLVIGNALLWTLEKGLQQSWTYEIEEVWAIFIQQIFSAIPLKPCYSNVAYPLINN